MYHEIHPTCTHAQKEITCSNASLHTSEQFYVDKNTSANVFIVWELKELTEYCQLLKKGSESDLEVRRCTTKFSHLAHMRRRRSPVPMQDYIPVNSSICIRTLDLLLRMCASWVNFVVHLRTSRARSELFLSRWQYSVNSFSSHTMNTLAEVFLCI